MARDKMHFRRMDEGTDADFPRPPATLHPRPTSPALPGLLLDMLTDAPRRTRPTPSTGSTHSLQSATRALRDDRDEEYVVCCLFHDIGESLGPFNHGEVAAAILRPFVSVDNYWMIAHHPTFQTYFYGQHLGIDPERAGRVRDQPLLRPDGRVLRPVRRSGLRP